MLHLLRADFYRLFRSKTAKIFLALGWIVPVFIVVMALMGGSWPGPEEFYNFGLLLVYPLAAAVFCPLFVGGMEHGGARARVAAGYSHGKVLLSAAVVGWLFLLALYTLAYIALAPFFDPPQGGKFVLILWRWLLGAALIASQCVLCTAAALCARKPAAALVTCFALVALEAFAAWAFGLLLGGCIGFGIGVPVLPLLFQALLLFVPWGTYQAVVSGSITFPLFLFALILFSFAAYLIGRAVWRCRGVR